MSTDGGVLEILEHDRAVVRLVLAKRSLVGLGFGVGVGVGVCVGVGAGVWVCVCVCVCMCVCVCVVVFSVCGCLLCVLCRGGRVLFCVCVRALLFVVFFVFLLASH